MFNYLNIEFNDISFDGIIHTLEKNGVESEECFAYDDYDKKERLLIDKNTARKIVERETNELKKVIKTIMLLENGGLDVLEWITCGIENEQDWDKKFNEEYLKPRNEILQKIEDFQNKNLIILDDFNPHKIKYF